MESKRGKEEFTERKEPEKGLEKATAQGREWSLQLNLDFPQKLEQSIFKGGMFLGKGRFT